VTIISAGRLDDFARRHRDAEAALAGWAQNTRSAAWRNLPQVRQTYRSADAVKVDSGRVVTVFNIRGNNYRLLTAISYPAQVVNVLQFLTHAEYDKEKWKKTL
jgi:mRNA interferase HigB